MKKLILINLFLVFLLLILPKENNIQNIVNNEEIIEMKQENNEITTRSAMLIRQEPEITKITTISQDGINFIKSFEGLHLEAYKLSGEKYWTIGYGHNSSNIYEGQIISELEAENLLKQDLVKYCNYVLKLDLELNQNEFDALVSFTYNCGESNLYRLTNNRTKQEIAAHITAYTKSSSSIFTQGLLKRRNAEKELFLKEVK